MQTLVRKKFELFNLTGTVSKSIIYITEGRDTTSFFNLSTRLTFIALFLSSFLIRAKSQNN